MGTADRFIRILVAVVLFYLYYAKIITGTLGLVGVIVGAVFILTSLISFCPLYTLLGINTCGVKK